MTTNATTLAAGAPTLGLNGPQFLWLYAGVLLVITVAVVLRHRSVYAEVDRRSAGLSPHDYRVLGPSELAYLAGGPRRAMLTAVTVLVERGVLEPRPTNGEKGVEYQQFTVRRAPHAQDGLDPLQYAVAEHCARTEWVTFDNLRESCAEPLDRLREALESRGLAFTPATHKRADSLNKLYWIALGLLGFRIATGLINDRPIGYLVAFLLLTLLVAGLTTRSRTHVSRAGELLDRARTDMAHLSPEYRPAYSTYGPLALPAAVALFGVGALAVVHPMLAENELVSTLAMNNAVNSVGYGTGCGSAGTGCSSGSDSGSGDGGGCGGGGCGGCGG